MTHDEVAALVTSMPGVIAFVAGEANGSPEVAWGDSFFYYDPDGNEANRQMPLATIVIKDYPGFDTASHLDRPGVFRLNIGAGREHFKALFGYGPDEHDERAAEFDYAALDTFIPHPTYATQGWVSILSPSAANTERIRALLTEAHRRTEARHRAIRDANVPL